MITPSTTPNFLCIGAKKAGTTWLAHNLGQHPNVWMPPVKELNYFNDDARIPKIFYLLRKSDKGRITRDDLRQAGVPSYWLFRYLCLFRNDAWYSSLFMPQKGQISGEAAPMYAILDESKIAHVKSFLPSLKILYILRNPVERIWSNAKMRVEKSQRRSINDLPEAEVFQLLQSRWGVFERESLYLSIAARWQKHYPSEQFYINFFDQLEAKPVEFFKSVLNFLDLPVDDQSIPPDLHIARNALPTRPMPPNVRRWIAEQIFPELESLHSHFGNQYTEAWLLQAKACLQ